ncbi:MBL fold metallo-hydrolase [Weeksellaceae bacterium A-14]
MLHLKRFIFNPFSENTYIVYNDQKGAFLIDPGNIQDFETAELRDFIGKNQLNIKNILLTHAHIDHVLGLQWAYDTYQVPVLMSEGEKEILDMNPMNARKYGFFFKPFEGKIQYIQEGENLHLGDDTFEVLSVPGHSPDHLAFYSKAGKILVSGDVLFQGSIGRTDLYKGNFEQLLHSIRSKIFVLEDETSVHSGHGDTTSVGFEKHHNPFLK